MRGFFQHHKAVLKNISWMYLMQVANYIFPLLTLPYLLRVVGLDKYGIIVLGQAVMGYLNVVVDYGFNLTATREIANFKHDLTKIRPVYNRVMQCKIGITFLLFIVGGAVLLIGSLDMSTKIFWLMAFTIVLGQLMNPIFFFQGIEDMKYITFANVIARTSYLVLLFLVVHEESDYIYAVLLQGVSGMIAGIMALYIAHKKYGMFISWQFNWKNIKYELIKGRPIFISNCCGNLYVQGSSVIVNFFAGNVATSYFSLATKISSVVCRIFQPVVQAIYPRLCQRFADHNADDMTRRAFHFTVIASFIACITTSIAAPLISWILKGNIDPVLVRDIHIANVMLFFTIMNVAMHPFILAMGLYDFVQKLYMVVSLCYLLVASVGSYFWQQEGMLASLILVELSISVSYYRQLFKRSTLK